MTKKDPPGTKRRGRKIETEVVDPGLRLVVFRKQILRPLISWEGGVEKVFLVAKQLIGTAA